MPWARPCLMPHARTSNVYVKNWNFCLTKIPWSFCGIKKKINVDIFFKIFYYFFSVNIKPPRHRFVLSLCLGLAIKTRLQVSVWLNLYWHYLSEVAVCGLLHCNTGEWIVYFFIFKENCEVKFMNKKNSNSIPTWWRKHSISIYNCHQITDFYLTT